ncbi:MAG: FkbM family methyltransferase [Chloroflexi bacterium]|nr:FkbM family methyltransferase [Chloroflexota bacterium]
MLRRDEFGDGLLWGRHAEQDELNVLVNILQPGMVLFDVGANQGLFTIVAAQAVGPTGMVHAFEPVPCEFQKLLGNVRMNHCKNVRLNRLALSSTEGETLMYACESYKGMYSSLRPPHVERHYAIETIRVLVSSLDAYVTRHSVDRMDFLKIDVEGGELDVVNGGSCALSSLRPIIQCEFSDRRTKAWDRRAREVGDAIAAFDYVWFEPVKSGLVQHTLRETYDYDDLLAVPREKIGMLEWLIVS